MMAAAMALAMSTVQMEDSLVDMLDARGYDNVTVMCAPSGRCRATTDSDVLTFQCDGAGCAVLTVEKVDARVHR